MSSSEHDREAPRQTSSYASFVAALRMVEKIGRVAENVEVLKELQAWQKIPVKTLKNLKLQPRFGTPRTCLLPDLYKVAPLDEIHEPHRVQRLDRRRARDGEDDSTRRTWATRLAEDAINSESYIAWEWRQRRTVSLLQEIQARVGLRKHASTSKLNGRSELNNEENISSGFATPSNGAAAISRQTSSQTATHVSEYLVGAQLDNALAAGEDIALFWPFGDGRINDMLQAEG